MILNAEVSIAGPNKTKAIDLIKPQVNDFDTVHPNILQKLEFPFLPASFKLQKLKSHRTIRDELFKIKELRNLLTNISRNDEFLREKLASNLSEFTEVIKLVDEDLTLINNENKVGSNPIIQRFEKTAKLLDELVCQAFRKNFGIDGISYENIEDVYDPLHTGFGSLQKIHEYLLSMGMNPETSRMLCRKYLNKLASKDNHQCTLMDLFTNQESKNALHRYGTDLRTVFLNFQSSDPKLSLDRDASFPRMPASVGPYKSISAAVRPPLGFY